MALGGETAPLQQSFKMEILWEHEKSEASREAGFTPPQPTTPQAAEPKVNDFR
jgi:hypothetical protein